MISGIDIKKTIIEIVKENFKYETLANDVEEDYSKPSFFCAVINDISIPLTINLTRKYFDIKLKLYGCNHNEMIKTSAKLHELFPLNLKVFDEMSKKYRYLLMKNKTADIEEYDKYMEFSFSLDFTDKTREITDGDMEKMGEIEIEVKKE